MAKKNGSRKVLHGAAYASRAVPRVPLRPSAGGEKPSLDLLRDPTFYNSVDSFAIRYHDAIGRGGKHFDYALGSKTGKQVIDFVIPKKVPAELEAKKGNLPPPGKPHRLLVMAPAHDQVYLNARAKKVHVIPEGEYGAGKWWIVVKGKAYVKTYAKGFIIGLKPSGERQFAEYKLYQHAIKGKPAWFIVRSGAGLPQRRKVAKP